METIKVQSLDDIDAAASTFLEAMGNRKIVAFEGDLGAGKTTFIKSLCRQLGSTDTVSSPTFAIVNEYEMESESGKVQPIFHMDLYRLKDLNEALDAGIEEYITGDYYCFIEWPDLIRSLLPKETLFTKIEAITEKSHRKITIFN